MRLLVVEDDPDLNRQLVSALSDAGYAVDTAFDGEEGHFLGDTEPYDAIVLDLGLPKKDGLDVLRTARRAANRIPVLILTARDSVADRVKGLDAGADDYLVKPFAFSELLARISALLRRPPISETKTVLRTADLEMDLLKRTVRRAGRVIDLQPQEFRLLEYLMRSEGRVVTRTMLLENVWDFHFDPQTSVVETHISRLRAKIDKGFGSELVRTIRGVGYCLREDV